MYQAATITSKRQLTLPIEIFRRAGLQIGQKVLVSEEAGQVTIIPAKKLIEGLAGSLTIPKKWQGKRIDQIIEVAKSEYFRKRIK